MTQMLFFLCRGHSKYHYYGIRLKPTSALNNLPPDKEEGQNRLLITTVIMIIVIIIVIFLFYVLMLLVRQQEWFRAIIALLQPFMLYFEKQTFCIETMLILLR